MSSWHRGPLRGCCGRRISAVTLLMTAPVLAAGCGGPIDPPGTVSPNEGNLSSESIAGDDAATSSSASSAGGGRTTPPKWSEIFSAYLNTGTMGNCVICHSEMSTASGAYSYLQSTDYISGTSSILAKTGSSCLSWFWREHAAWRAAQQRDGDFRRERVGRRRCDEQLTARK